MPFLQNLTMQQLVGDESSASVVNYNTFVSSDIFTNNLGNLVLWAPIRHSPGASIDSSTLKSFEKVQAYIIPEVFATRFNLLPDGGMVRGENCGHFFPEMINSDTDSLSSQWVIPAQVSEAITERFRNQPSPALKADVSHRTRSDLKAKLSLPKFTGRKLAPKTVRVSMRQITQPEMPLRISFRKNGDNYQPLDKKEWLSVPAELHPSILILVKKAFAGEKAEAILNWKDRKASAACIMKPISWPYPPVHGHIMGIDSAGRDVFARVLYAMRISMAFGITLSIWAMFIGMIIGSIQGYFGGKIDICGQRLTEIWSALPFLYIMILVGSVLGRSFMILLFCYSLFNWVVISRYMRAEFLRLRANTFVEAARCQGLSAPRIIFGHILPNAMTPIITLLPFILVGAIGSLAALDFLGFGLPPLTPSWGELVAQAQQFRGAWWLILFPSLALVLVILLTVIIGEGLRDAFDPKQQSRME